MFTLHDHPDPLLLYAGFAGGEHVWLGLLTPRAVMAQPGFTSATAYTYETPAGRSVIDAVLRAVAAGHGGTGVAGLAHTLGNGARSTLALVKDSCFRQGITTFVPPGHWCIVFRQTLNARGTFLWTMDPTQTLIDPATRRQRVGAQAAHIALNEALTLQVARHGLVRAWHVRVVG